MEPSTSSKADLKPRVVDNDDVASEGPIDENNFVNQIIDTTREFVAEEREVGVLEAFKLYPKAMFWACFFNIGIIMVGFDAQVITTFFALDAFVEKYGAVGSDGTKYLSPAWQTGLSMGSPIGQVLGSLLISYPSDKYGRKWVFFFSTILLAMLNFMQFFAPTVGVLCAGEILGGIVWGFFITLGPTYASEVAPLPLRAILTGFTNLAFVTGQFVCQGLIAGVEGRDDKWAYRIPFALQWMWCAIIIVIAPFAPESPWHLVRHGRSAEAKKQLHKLQWHRGVDLDHAIFVIEQTDLLEHEYSTTSTYFDCFKGTNLIRTEICIMVYSIQVLCGNNMIGYSTYFFELAGLQTTKAFDMGVGINAVGFFATCLTFVILSSVGRRPLFNFGLSIMTVLLFLIAILDCPPSYMNNSNLAWAQASLLIIWTFFYQLTVGPLTFVLISEISSTQLRTKTIATATAVQAVCAIVMTVAVPYMFSVDYANMRGKIGFFFGGLSAICLVWSFMRLPETMNRTFEELDIMFERKIPLNKFEKYDVLGVEQLEAEVNEV